jgi:hypothetical protein
MPKPDWKKIVGTVAPTLATALGGPLAGVAVKTIADKVLGNAQADESEVAAVISGADPETLMKLKQAEYDFRKAMEELEVERDRLAYGDRASAREREIKTGDNWTPRIIAAIVIVGWFTVQWYLLQYLVPQENREIVMRGLGTLDLAVGMVLGYYFGSSAGSREKNQIISKMDREK